MKKLRKSRFRRQLVVDRIPAFLDHLHQPLTDLEIFGNTAFQMERFWHLIPFKASLESRYSSSSGNYSFTVQSTK
jgi:hypothetical protein